jgi:prevent-host-death family protein
MAMKNKIGVAAWTVARAKAEFGLLLKEAEIRGPQTITRNGRVTAVLFAVREWERKVRRGNLAEFLLASPLRHSGVNAEKLPVRLRRVF